MLVEIKPDSRGLDPAIHVYGVNLHIPPLFFGLDGRIKCGHDNGQ